eukprot:scaffold263247_cov27-Tisochrysis_lutea.AAC.2
MEIAARGRLVRSGSGLASVTILAEGAGSCGSGSTFVEMFEGGVRKAIRLGDVDGLTAEAGMSAFMLSAM